MTNKKNGFFTFIFSLLPGAGEMYLGFMKRGVSTMAVFFLIIAFSVWSGISPFMFVLPIVWFYSFFTVHNLRSLPDDEFFAVEDNFIFNFDGDKDKALSLARKYKNVIAIFLIVVGVSTLWNNLNHMFMYLLPDIFREFINSLSYYGPQTLISFAIIALGVYLIRGKKKELDLLEDKGGNHNENS